MTGNVSKLNVMSVVMTIRCEHVLVQLLHATNEARIIINISSVDYIFSCDQAVH